MPSHVSLAGIAARALLHAMPSAAGFAAAVLGAAVVECVRRSFKTYGEISVAVIMIGGLSTAVLLMGLNKRLNRNIDRGELQGEWGRLEDPFPKADGEAADA